MADYQAIADVTRTLRTLLLDRVEYPEPFDVTTVPPDINAPARHNEGVWINLYLYHINENAALKNQEIPPVAHPGAYGHPPLSLDLYYLMTVRSPDEALEDSDVYAQLLLGSAMRVFHDVAVVTEDLTITRSTAGVVGDPILWASLRGEFEKLKLILAPLNMDELSKIWTALPQGSFRRSVAYQVSVIQILSGRPRRFPRLVGEPPEAGPRVYTLSVPSLRIDEIRVRRSGEERPYPYARIGDTLVLLGQGFAGAGTRVRLGSIDREPDLHQDGRIEIEVPDHAALQPGPQTVRVIREVLMGQPAQPHLGFQSNLALFMLVPRIDGLTADLGPAARHLRIEGARLYLERFSGETLIGDALVPRESYLGIPTPTELSIPLPDGLPDWPTTGLVSGDLSSFPAPGDMTAPLNVRIDAEGPHALTLSPPPGNLSEAAPTLQAALRHTGDGGPGFEGARVTTLGSRLLVIPGGLRHSVTMEGDTADALSLSAVSGATTEAAYLSGALRPFPELTSASPQVALTVDGAASTVTPSGPSPMDLAAAAEWLRLGLQDAGFTLAQVGVLGDQLVILVGVAASSVRFGPVPHTDETTVSELRLSVDYPVRVRVNGAEDIDNRRVTLP